MEERTINDMISEKVKEAPSIGKTESENESVAPNQEAGINLSGIFDFVKTSTGAGSIDDYIENPLNFSGSKGLAQVLRGLSGFVGAISEGFALVDIIIGAVRCSKEQKAGGQAWEK